MIDFTKAFETKRILLRPIQPTDYQEFVKLTNDKNLWTYFTRDLSDKETLLNWVKSAVQAIQHQKRLAFSIIDKPSNTLIGSTSIGNISERDKRVEIGWTWLGRDFHGKGLNDEVKYTLLTYCFEDLNCERVEFKTDVLNKPARKALRRLGAIEEGTLRSHTLMVNNRRRDTIYYSILKEEWKGIKEKPNRA